MRAPYLFSDFQIKFPASGPAVRRDPKKAKARASAYCAPFASQYSTTIFGILLGCNPEATSPFSSSFRKAAFLLSPSFALNASTFLSIGTGKISVVLTFFAVDEGDGRASVFVLRAISANTSSAKGGTISQLWNCIQLYINKRVNTIRVTYEPLL